MRYLFGPELFWILIYGLSNLLASANVPPRKGLDNFIENCWLYIPLLAALTFALWWVPAVEKNWLLLRVWIVGIIGGHYTMEKVMSAYSDQGPGIGTAYILGMICLFMVLLAGSIFIKIKF